MRAFTPKEVSAMLRKPKGRVRNVAAKEDRTYNGRVYHSKAEAAHAFKLDYDKSVAAWIPQPAFPIVVNGVKICSVILDFSVKYKNSREIVYQEIKGWETPEWKLKKKLLLACYPDLKLEVIKA